MSDSVTPSRGVPATHVAGGYLEAAERALQEALGPSKRAEVAIPENGWREVLGRVDSTVASRDRPVWLRVWDNDLSPGTRYRLLQKRKKLEKPKAVHYKTRLKKRREEYRRTERDGKLRRDRWLTSCPEGLYKYYKSIAHRKGIRWAITEESFCELLREESGGSRLFEKIFNIVRIDKDKTVGYTVSNIELVDRYTGTVYYSPRGE